MIDRVVVGWSQRILEVYKKCMGKEGVDYSDPAVIAELEDPFVNLSEAD